MKKLALITGALCAITSGAFAQQSVVIIPAFQNRFASIHEPVVALNTVNSSAGFESQSFGGSASTTSSGANGIIVTSPTAGAFRQPLNPTTMNIPVFPGNTVLLQQQGVLGFNGFGIGGVPAGFGGFGGLGNSGVFVEQGGGSQLVPVDPFRTTATPGPAVNAVPNPAAPAATAPQLHVSPTTTVPVQQQIPTTLVPGTPVIQGAPQGQIQGNTPAANTPSPNTPNR